MVVNELGQPVGEPLEWAPRPPVRPVTLVGRTCRVEGLTAGHDEGLYDALVRRSPESIWTYLSVGPFADDAAGRQGLVAWLTSLRQDPAAVPHAITDPAGEPLGVASYLRLNAVHGSVEVGGIALGAALQRTTAATEAMYLMARHAFDDLGYRRYEWKCDDLNGPSRRAAQRLGFGYEGTFRNAVVYKGRTRDTAWFSITAEEWPRRRQRLERWLEPDNFDEHGVQREPLGLPAGQLPDAVPDVVRRPAAPR